MTKEKKIPMRKCLATGEQLPKMEMFRIVRTPNGEVIIDDAGKANGRGAYVSKSKDAILLAKKKKCLDRELEVKVPDSIYEDLLARLA